MNAERKKLIVVVAMHRSGSSAITNALPLLGVHLGDSLLSPIEGNNAKGFFEDEELNALNIEMLKFVGNDWHHLVGLSELDFERLQLHGFQLKAIELLRAKTREIGAFGFKDPRVSKLLPFWQKVFAHCDFEVSYLLTLRNPISVARSLTQRNAFAPGKSYLLWLQHVLAGISQTQGANRVIVDYDDFLHDPDGYLKLCARQFGLNLNESKLQGYKSEFLDLGLRHTTFTPEDFSREITCPPLANEVYSALRECALGQCDLDSTDVARRSAAWTNELERLKAVFVLTDTLSAQVDEYYHAAIECGQLLNNQREVSRSLEQRLIEAEQQGLKDASQLRERVRELSEQNTSLDDACRQATVAESNRERDTANQQATREHEFNARLLAERNESQRIADDCRQTLMSDRAAAAMERENLIRALIEAQRSVANGVEVQNQLNAAFKSHATEQLQAHVTRENALRAENRSLHLEISRAAEQRAEAERTLNDRLYELQIELRSVKTEDSAQIDALNAQLQELKSNLADGHASFKQHVAVQRDEHLDLKQLLQSATDQLRTFEREIQVSRTANETLEAELFALKTTLSWRCTAPFRSLGRRLRIGRPVQRE